MTRDAVTSDQLPPSGLPISVAVRGGGLLFLSGQVAQDPATGELVDGDVAQQADQILRNITAILAAIGKDLDNVIRVGVYLTDMSQFGAMNEAWPPCRWARRSRWMWWWAEVSAGGTRSSGTVIFAMRARHSAKAAQNWSVCVQDPCCNPPAAAGHSWRSARHWARNGSRSVTRAGRRPTRK
jgi:2-iminobutanoate/2-iminopropanoate deaminase